MGKTRKYTVQIIVHDKVALDRIRYQILNNESTDLDIMIDQGPAIIIGRTGLSGIEVLKYTSHILSNLNILCCRKTDKNGIPDNWKFALELNNSITNLFNAINWEITGKALDKYMKETLESEMDYYKESEGNVDITHIRLTFNDMDNKYLCLAIGYDWEE